MSGKKLKKRINKEFKKIVKNKFLSPHDCNQLYQTRTYIFELNKIIKHFENKFDHVPNSAQLLFYEYNIKHEEMLYEKYKEEFIKD